MSTDSHTRRSLIMSHPIYNRTVWQFLDLKAEVDEEKDKNKEDEVAECTFLLNLQLFYF